jgi:hypothetical protein
MSKVERVREIIAEQARLEFELAQLVGEASADSEEKPKRHRRTKAEMEQAEKETASDAVSVVD